MTLSMLQVWPDRFEAMQAGTGVMPHEAVLLVGKFSADPTLLTHIHNRGAARDGWFSTFWPAIILSASPWPQGGSAFHSKSVN